MNDIFLKALVNLFIKIRPRRWMITCCAIMLVLTILPIGLIGCNRTSPDEADPPLSDVELPAVSGETPGSSGETPGADTDVPDWIPEPIKINPLVVDPDQTGDLIIYLPPFSKFGLMIAIDAYKEMYPNVNVIIETPSDTDSSVYSSRLSTELMAGTGPDIIFPRSMVDAEPGKLLNTDAFLDLNDLIESDDSFNLDDYVKAVLDGGLHNGKRYIMPYTYMVPIYSASTKTLNEIGFDMSQSTDLISFVNEAVRCLPKAQENPNFRSLFDTFLWSDITRFFGISLVDFETGEILPDEDSIRELFEAYKPYHHIDSDSSRTIQSKFAESLRNGARSFLLELAPHGFFERTSYLKGNGGFEMLVIPGINGKTQSRAWDTAAIRSGSPNTENAWNFIKLLLSPVTQSNVNITAVWLPVHKEVLINKIEMDWYDYDGVVTTSTGDQFTCTRLSEAEMRAYMDAVLSVEDSLAYESHIIRSMLNDHIKPYFEGAVSLDATLSGLKSQLLLYLTE